MAKYVPLVEATKARMNQGMQCCCLRTDYKSSRAKAYLCSVVRSK